MVLIYLLYLYLEFLAYNIISHVNNIIVANIASITDCEIRNILLIKRLMVSQ